MFDFIHDLAHQEQSSAAGSNLIRRQLGNLFRLKRGAKVSQLQLESAVMAPAGQRELLVGVALIRVLEYISDRFTYSQDDRVYVLIVKTTLSSKLPNHLPNQTKPARVAGDCNLQFFGHSAGSAGLEKQPAKALEFSGHYITARDGGTERVELNAAVRFEAAEDFAAGQFRRRNCVVSCLNARVYRVELCLGGPS